MQNNLIISIWSVFFTLPDSILYGHYYAQHRIHTSSLIYLADPCIIHIIFSYSCPSNSKESVNLVTYILIPFLSDEVRDRGFTMILDMRGTKWETMKPILKALQECFPGNINMAFIIKPEKFWEKQRTSLGSSKYNFEVFYSTTWSLWDICVLVFS